MKKLPEALAPHLMSVEDYQFIKQLRLFDLTWSQWVKVEGNLTKNIGLVGQVKLTSVGMVSGIGKEIGFVYNDDAFFDLVSHAGRLTTRLTADIATGKVTSYSNGPSCCTKKRQVTRVKNGENTIETRYVQNRPSITTFNADNNIISIQATGVTKNYLYSAQSDYPREHIDDEVNELGLPVGVFKIHRFIMNNNESGRVRSITKDGEVYADFTMLWHGAQSNPELLALLDRNLGPIID